jgi:hypothetical protein
MNSIIKLENIESLILEVRKQKVILDSDVAKIYGVETKRVNEAVKNNPDKFPNDYLFELTKSELENLRSKFSTTKFSKTRVTPKAFTEKGLYMLATILRSRKAVNATFAIIETFAKVKELTKAVKELSDNPEKEKQKSLMKKSGEIISELLDDELQTTESETTIELNFAVLKFKHTVKRNS